MDVFLKVSEIYGVGNEGTSFCINTLLVNVIVRESLDPTAKCGNVKWVGLKQIDENDILHVNLTGEGSNTFLYALLILTLRVLQVLTNLRPRS